jgi:hypothetical protein
MAEDKCWVLPGLGPHNAIARPALLSERQTQGCQNRGVGVEDPRKGEGIASQSQVGAAVRKVPRAIGGRESDSRWDG